MGCLYLGGNTTDRVNWNQAELHAGNLEFEIQMVKLLGYFERLGAKFEIYIIYDFFPFPSNFRGVGGPPRL